MNKKVPDSIDEYILSFPEKTQEYLSQIRLLIKKTAKNTSEKISYGIPTIMLGGTYLIYFSGNKNHIGMYPIPKGDIAFHKEIEPFQHGRSTLKFALSKSLPESLIKKIIQWAVINNKERQKNK